MTIEQELRLSYYREVARVKADREIYLVQDVRTDHFYVKKQLKVYHLEIYRHLLAHPVPNTPRIILLEESDGILTVIEEYIPGDTLEEILEREGILSEAQTIEITARLCDILSAFHHCTPPIVNRDIKPSNIKITPDGIVKVVDLNAAKWGNSAEAKDTMLLGTQGYAAPEQYGFGPSSVLTDLYSLGVLMNVMRTGMLPNQRLAEGRLGKIISVCVQLSPSARYQSAEAVKRALDALADGNRPGSSGRSWRQYFPPGFRSGGPINGILAGIGYWFLLQITTSLVVEGAGPVETAINRVMFTAGMLAVVLFSGNYLNVHQSFILTRSRHPLIRWIGIAVADFAIILLTVLVIGLLVDVMV